MDFVLAIATVATSYITIVALVAIE